ncbi:hypothetical protein LJR164_000913 [Phenylobacterium sp. LjRoot164]|uniref:hypothetical protein n=1 Tax=unclassified Phenylobacterium TaxID=2640670 RepID=UPI003ECD1FF3
MSWELVGAMLVEVARGRGGRGGLRTWFGTAPYASSQDEELQAIAQMAGYALEAPDAFVELSADAARETLAFFAADSMVTPRGRPASAETVEAFAKGIERLGPSTRFFSNGRWHEYATSGSFGSYAISKATFDGGVIGTNGEVAFIVWAEEED